MRTTCCAGSDLLWRLEVAWDRAAEAETVVLVGWLRTADNPQSRLGVRHGAGLFAAHVRPPGPEVEKDALRSLPAGPFVLATWATAKIGPDIHAQVDKVLYSVPWRHIGKTADVRLTATMVQFFIGGDLVKSHPRKARGKRPTSGTTRQLCGISGPLSSPSAL